MATVPVVIETPCGNLTVNVPVPALPLPNLDLIINFKLPKVKIPLPDCSLLKHSGAEPDPPEDSEP